MASKAKRPASCAYYIHSLDVSGDVVVVTGLYWKAGMPAGISRGFKQIRLVLREDGRVVRGPKPIPSVYGGTKVCAVVEAYTKYLATRGEMLKDGVNPVGKRFIRR